MIYFRNVHQRLCSVKGFLEIQPKVALTIGISAVIGAGIAYGSVKWLNSVYGDRPPKKLVSSISLQFLSRLLFVF